MLWKETFQVEVGLLLQHGIRVGKTYLRPNFPSHFLNQFFSKQTIVKH